MRTKSSSAEWLPANRLSLLQTCIPNCAGYLTQAAYQRKYSQLPINIVSACLGVVLYSALDISDYIALMVAQLMYDGLQSDWKEVFLP